MFLNEIHSGKLVEVLDSSALFDPFMTQVIGRYNAGEELPDPMEFTKTDLHFCSGEPLPRCWMDPQYRAAEVHRSGTHG
jgi:hypothetical protein